ncbi:unnamed protein product [Fusarium graminearum]|nr:unnamed protein product [Fusarium graminearum]
MNSPLVVSSTAETNRRLKNDLAKEKEKNTKLQHEIRGLQCLLNKQNDTITALALHQQKHIELLKIGATEKHEKSQELDRTRTQNKQLQAQNRALVTAMNSGRQMLLEQWQLVWGEAEYWKTAARTAWFYMLPGHERSIDLNQQLIKGEHMVGTMQGQNDDLKAAQKPPKHNLKTPISKPFSRIRTCNC